MRLIRFFKFQRQSVLFTFALLLFSIFFVNNIYGQGGVTLITHGFSATGHYNDEFTEIAKAIRAKSPGASVFKNDLDSGKWKRVPLTGSSVQSTKEIILIYDWAELSNNLQDGYLEAAADNLFALLLAPPSELTTPQLGTTGLINKQLHFIGHSRGCILLLQVCHRIKKYFPTNTIDQLTLLDPHPASPMNDVSQSNSNLSLPCVNGLPSSCGSFGCSRVGTLNLSVPENVTHPEVYYRKGTIYEPILPSDWRPANIGIGAFSGISFKPITDIYNRELNNDTMTNHAPTAGGAHAAVHRWYLGTIDANFIPLNDNWYTTSVGTFMQNETRSTTGYYHSRIGGGSLPPSPNIRDKILQRAMDKQIANRTNSDLNSGLKSIFNGSFQYVDAGWTSTVLGSTSSLSNISPAGHATLTGTEGIKHNLMFFSSDYTKLQFSAKTLDGTGIIEAKVSFFDYNGKKIQTGINKPEPSTTTFKKFSVDIPKGFRDNNIGKVGYFSIENTDNSGRNTILVDDVLLTNQAKGNITQIAPTNGGGITESLNDYEDMVFMYRDWADNTFDNIPSSAWFKQYAQEGANYGLIEGSAENTYNQYENLTRGEATAIIVNSALKLGVLRGGNLNISTANGTFSDVPITHPYFPYIQALRNLGYLNINSTNTFNPQDNITLGQFCKILSWTYWDNPNPPVTNPNVNASSRFNVTIDPNTNPDYIPHIRKILNTFTIKNKSGKRWVERIFNFKVNALSVGYDNVIDANVFLDRASIAKAMTNVFEFRKNELANTANASNFITIGEKWELPTTATATTGSITTVNDADLTVVSGSVNVFSATVSSLSNPHFYWSIDGGSFTSNSTNFNTVTFTAPTVTTTTTFNLYVYAGSTLGNAVEILKKIIVNPTTAPTPTAPTIQTANLQVTGQGTNSISLQWQRGNGQSCILVGEEVGANAMDAPQTNIVYSGNSNLTTAPPVFSGSDTKVLYTGTGNSLTVTGLDANTTYRFAVYEYNGSTAANVRYLVANPAYGTGATNPIAQTIASFSWNTNQHIVENNATTFTSTSVNYTSLSWSVSSPAIIQSGQGTATPSIFFPTAGNYTLTLTAYNSSTGLSNTVTIGLPVLSLTQIRPDLQGMNGNANPRTSTLNNTINISCQVTNTGQSYNQQTYVQFYFSRDQILDANDFYFNGQDFTVNSISPNTLVSVNQSFYLGSAFIGYSGANTYYILCVVDGGNYLNESNENNNLLSIPIYLSDAMPDLQVSSLSISPTTIASGQRFSISSTIINNGTMGASGGWDMGELFLSSNNTLSTDDIRVSLYQQADNYFSLGRGQTASNTYTNISIPSNIPNGAYYFIFVMDYNQYIRELNENNNTFVIPVTVNNPNQPTVQATNLQITNITSNGCQLSWNNGNGTGRIVLVSKNDVFRSENLPLDGTNYIANNNYGIAGVVNNIANNGGYPNPPRVLYLGTNNNITVTGLSPDTTYFFTVFEYNNTGSNIDYLQYNPVNSTIMTTLSASPILSWDKIGQSAPLTSWGQVFWKDIHFTSNLNGIAVTRIGTAITGDGGKTWKLFNNYNFIDKYTSLKFVNSQTGFAFARSQYDNYVQNNIGLVRTSDGGNSWQKISTVSDNREMTDISFVSPIIGFLSCAWERNNSSPTGGQVLKTIDGGLTWSLLYSFPKPIFSLYFINSSIGYAAAWGGNIYKTTDGGASWTEKNFATSGWEVMDILFKDSQVGFFVDTKGQFRKTVDGGNTWSSSLLPYFSGNDFSDKIKFKYINNTLYASYNSVIAASTNDGATWNIVANFNPTNNIFSIGGPYGVFDVLENDMWLAGMYGFFKSTTGGQSQTAVLAPLSNTSYCQGSALSSAYTLVGSFNSGNVFTLELSDANGSFVSPTELATATSTTQGNLSGVIPANISAGTGYKMRIRSSNPVSLSAESAAFSITAPPSVSITNLANSYLSTATPITLSATPAGGTFKVNGTTATQFNPSVLGAGTHTVTYEVIQGSCSAAARQIVNITVPMSATATVANSSLCAGSTLAVNYNVSGVFDANNVFTVELSNETGSFTTPTVIGTFSNSGANTLACILPQGLIAGNQYRVRIVAAAPAFVGANSGVFTIQSAPLVSVALNVSPSNVICNNDAVTFTAAPSNGGTTPQYQWKLNGANVGTNTFRYQNSSLSDGDVVYVEMISNAVCAGNTPSVSTPVSMQVTTVPKPQIFAIDSTLASSATTGNQWYRNGVAIQGATGQFYTTNARGFYTVTVLQNGCSNTSDIFQHNPTTSTKEESDITGNISIFPNPTFGQVTLELKDLPLDHAEILVFNSLGQLLFKKAIVSDQTSLDFSPFATGLYHLKVKTSKGEAVKKVLVQR